MPDGWTDLCGTWRICPGDDELRRAFAGAGYDDSGWAEAAVPGHWQATSGLESWDGPVLHRRSFATAAPVAGRRSFVVFDGMFYQGDVWFDGLYLGDTEGYFVPHAFDVTEALADRSEHVLAVELTCAPQPSKKLKRNITGIFQDGELLDHSSNPGGIWRPVRIEHSGPVRISTLRVRCTEATPERARLEMTAELDSTSAREVVVRSRVGSVDHERTDQLTAGTNAVSWRLDIPDPPLWWPRALGEQPLVDVSVEVVVETAVSDRRTVRTGLRQVRLDRWIMTLNGERIFLKGATTGPTRARLAYATGEEIAADAGFAHEAGLDLLRLQAHISRPELYEAADRTGLLLWQDLPLQWAYARGLRREASRQARAAVDLLGHHPSVVLWCAHNEPFTVDLAEPPARRRRRFLVGTFMPTWNKTVLDVSVARTLERADGSRPVVSHAGVLPHPAWGTDSHLSFGWRHGSVGELPGLLRRLPVLARFVADFGAQSVPASATWMEPERWPDLDWDRLEARHHYQRHLFDRHVPPERFDTFAAWQAATQAYQAELLQQQVEALRRLKYNPTGGFCVASLADAHPAVSTAVLDHGRVPKAGFAALQAACAPVLLTADRLRREHAPGEAVALDVHIVSDLRHGLSGCRVDARLTWEGGQHRWSFAGEVEADSVAFVGTLCFVVPDAPGQLRLELLLSGPILASATYESRVGPRR